MFSLYVSTDENARKMYLEFVDLFKKNRFLINEEHDFIKHYLSSLKNNIITVKAGSAYFRGRINEEIPFGDNKDLHAPPQGKASAGRVNPKGISYLYTAEEKDTVIAEVRPWISVSVAIAKCTAKFDLKLVDLIPLKEDLMRLNNYRRVISKEFSKPIKPNNKEIEYLPTQYIAEYFKRFGYDGIRYTSSVYEGGKNVVFFNPELIDIQIIDSVTINAIEYR